MKTIEDALNEFLENPYWKKLYDNAPERVKPYLKAQFANALLEDSSAECKKADKMLAEAKETMRKSDWKYLYENDGQNGIVKWHYKAMMEKAKE